MSARGFLMPRWSAQPGAHYERVEATGVTMLRNARLGGVQTLAGAVCVAAVLPLVPPTEAIGDSGWAIAAAFGVGAAITGIWLLRTRMVTPRQHLALLYLVLAMVSALTWLAGGTGAPYPLFLALTVQHIAVHPLRRVTAFLALMCAGIALPLIYADTDPGTVAFIAGIVPTLLALAASLTYAINDLYGDAVAREIADATARTEADVARRTAEAARAAASRLRELNQMKEGFVSTVSHELRSPLTSVKGYLEGMLDGEVGELNPEQREYTEIVYRNSTRLQSLVDDLLVLSRMEAGKLTLEPERFDLVASVRAACRRAAVNAAADAPAIEEKGPERLEITADRRRIEQVVGNLVSNALKFGGGGGPVTVLIRGNGIVQLEVSDHGIGIPAADLSRLGERFFRASNAGVAPGSGLGLAIARELIGRHKGVLVVDSTEGEGTTVRASWPREVSA